ncbi:N-alpha-acetyltransferase 38, NatC auxiliary subunit isoform X1 [Anopheles darlingi]|uniref:N-alpha-acetyltransferase 38, NatC auxiliary subunit isoform X1 n=1 Tax=Anopheles darlingi TaxID=43151 RepID=UPI0021000850|nr:N-alpha-acetyltransferase 38, NatC auxiliary subunit isoform X1 [Anopheles darlingi]
MEISEAENGKSAIIDPEKNKYQQVLEQALEKMQPNDEDSETEEVTLDETELAKARERERILCRDNRKRDLLKSWLNRMFRIKMTDGRILMGFFVCTDADANVVLQLASEYTEIGGEERYLGLVMIPGRYIVSIEERIENLYSPWFG